MTVLGKLVKAPVIAVLLTLILNGYALFFEPLIGLADNGDYSRVMVPNNLTHERDRDINDYFGFFNPRYDRLVYYNEFDGSSTSTHSMMIRFASFIDDVFTRDNKFDIRFLSLLNVAILCLAVYWLVDSFSRMTEHVPSKYIIAFLAVFIFSDTGYTAYFNSFFGEGFAYCFFLLSFASVLKFSHNKEKTQFLVIFAISTIGFIGTKDQLSVNGLLAFALLSSFAFIGLSKKIIYTSISLGLVLVVAFLFFYTSIQDSISLINKYHMVTRGVLLFEPDAEEVIEELGIERRYALLAETIYFDSFPVINPRHEILMQNFYPNYSIASVTLYYLRNPRAFSKMLEFGWKNSFTVRPEVLGNFERKTSKPYGARTNFFTGWSTIKDSFLPNTSGFVYTLIIACIATGIDRVMKGRYRGKFKEALIFELGVVYCILTGFSQLLVSFIGAGDTDLKKHLFMTTVSIDVVAFVAISYILVMVYGDKAKSN